MTKELTLEEKASYFDILVDTLDIGFLLMSKGLDYRFISEGAYEKMNLTPNQLKIGDNLTECYDVSHYEDSVANPEVFDELLETSQQIKDEKREKAEHFIKFKNGFTQKVISKKHKSGNIITFLENVTKLVEKDNLFEEALELGQAGYWIFDLRTKSIQLSNSVYSYFDRETIKLIQTKGILAGVHPDFKSEFHNAIKNAHKTGDKFEVTCKSITTGDQEQWNRTSGQIIRDTRGKPIKIRAFIQDTTLEKKRAEELQSAKDSAIAASKAKSEFLANMSHEIRTPMNGVLGMAELLDQSEITDRQRDYVKVITRSSEALLTIINDILDFSKIEAGAFELDPIAFNMRHAIDDVMALLAVKAQEKQLELIVNYPSDLPRGFYGDVGRIRQVITNLLGNAIKFTDKGQIILSVDITESPDGRAHIRTEVRDTGIGIEPDKLNSIFEKFTQADGSTTRVYGGTGLGLTISKKIANLMDGDIKVTSKLGQGSTFTYEFYIPFDDSAIGFMPQNDPLRGYKALIVDDIEINREILTERVKSWGMESASTHDGVSALIALSEAEKSGHPFNLVLLDQIMPKMDGLELARLISQNQPENEVQIIMLSSGPQDVPSQELRALNIAKYITKPVSEQSLFDAIYNVMHTPSVIGTEPDPSAAVNNAKVTTNQAIGHSSPQNSSKPQPDQTVINPPVNMVPVHPPQPDRPKLASASDKAMETLNEIEAVLDSVPAARSKPNNRTASGAVSHSPANHVLVAEDFPLNQEVVGLMLEESPYDADFASNGKEAVDMYKANPEKYVAILMDISMPVMDGYEASELIKSIQKISNRPPIPIIALTGHALKHDREKCLESNMDDYLTKPVKQGDLVATLDRWVLSEPDAVKSA